MVKNQNYVYLPTLMKSKGNEEGGGGKGRDRGEVKQREKKIFRHKIR